MAEKLATGAVSFKDTLNLPQTEFPIRAQAAIDDPLLIERWKKEDLFTTSFNRNKGNDQFVLHDGPPYSNGHIHLGHAYNKILKDIVTKSQRMMGKYAPVTPGWDCHGLPIELKVSQENPGVSRSQLKKACRAYAEHWINVQREEFKRLGVLMDWDRPYTTMSYSYEAAILRAFGRFVDANYIERKNKTVPWCASCQTVLATAEIEYQERKDPSIYVLFPLEPAVTQKLFPHVEGPLNIVIWTTTPWTLPLNRAVLVKPHAEYVVIKANGKYLAVGKQLADELCTHLGVSKEIVAEFNSDALLKAHARAHHPFIPNLTVPFLGAQSVELTGGTAFVHCAPGAGPEDYEVGVRNNIEVFSPVGPDGKYTEAVEPKELVGMSISDGQIWVIKKLTELDRLLFKTSLRHSFPHCWRCRNGLIFRATKQWFCDLSKHNLKDKTLVALDDIETVPENSINRLKATLEGRLEWCLSRQRVWGSPIPALICKGCDEAYTTPALINMVADKVEKAGIEWWDEVTVEELVPAQHTCKNCGGSSFRKEEDILDVWFDSGVSHFAVLEQNQALAMPANMYLEGSDQHRGWFQSSVLTSMVLNGKPPMRTIVTHGYTVDDQGRKMSKSLGNGVLPHEIIEKIGTDGLRLWVSTIDSSRDVVVSEVLLKNVQEVFRKIRNTSRFLLSNLYDFDIEKDAIPFDQMRMIDQYALQSLYACNADTIAAYEAYDFTAVFHKLADYCAVDLSAFYLDIVKDRLYVELPSGHARRSAQTACWYILDTLTRLMAPILSFTAEQLSDNYQRDKKESIHLQSFGVLPRDWEKAQESSVALEQRWALLKSIRSALLKAIEEQREKGLIKHSLEVRVNAFVDVNAPLAEPLQQFFAELIKAGESPEQFFKEFVIVSQCVFTPRAEGMAESLQKGLYLTIEKAAGTKCPRCWQWEVTSYADGLCGRCAAIVEAIRNK
jgi:isoleucyl-tRNA synthetase